MAAVENTPSALPPAAAAIVMVSLNWEEVSGQSTDQTKLTMWCCNTKLKLRL